MDQLLQRIRSTALQRDSSLEWLLVGLVARVDVLLVRVPVEHTRPQRGTIREGLVYSGEKLQLHGRALERDSESWLPPVGGAAEPHLWSTKVGFDEVIHLLAGSPAQYDPIGLALDFSEWDEWSPDESTSPLSRAFTEEEIAELRRAAEALPCSASIRAHAAQLIAATDPDGGSLADRARELFERGAPPTVVGPLLSAARARALFHGHSQVEPDDVGAALLPALRHRVVRSRQAVFRDIAVDRLLAAVIRAVPPPEPVLAEPGETPSQSDPRENRSPVEDTRPAEAAPMHRSQSMAVAMPIAAARPQPALPEAAPRPPSNPAVRERRLISRRPSLLVMLFGCVAGGLLGLAIGFEVLCRLYPNHYHWSDLRLDSPFK